MPNDRPAYCPHCGESLPEFGEHCPSCGESVTEPGSHTHPNGYEPCPHCGEYIPGEATVCPDCGNTTEQPAPSNDDSTNSMSPWWTDLPGLGTDQSIQNTIMVGVYIVLTLAVLGAAASVLVGGSGGESSNVYVVIDYEGEWSGYIGADGQGRTVDGQGREVFEISGGPTIVSANAQKRDRGTGTLTITVEQGDEVLAQQSTNGQFGIVQVSSETL